jgi:SAM-dependent methyltransferase
MNRWEVPFALLRPFDHPLNQRVAKTLRGLKPARLLDIGGRKSPYTIGLPAEVWISDLPRESAVQNELNLGATDAIRETVLRKRSNIKQYVYDDMTRSTLPNSHFDAVNATEVLEHVDEDEAFVRHVARVLKPGGYFCMSTPNGDWKPNPWPADHRRHYKARDLEALLRKHFSSVRVEHFVHASWMFERAFRCSTLGSMPLYWLANVTERMGFVPDGPMRKHHLFAVAVK